MSINIIGAGIGGLTVAIALKQKGFDVRIFEQATELKPFGAGIVLAHNAMEVYKKLGLDKVIEEKGNQIGSLNITNPDLKCLSSLEVSHFEHKYKTKTIAIHRATFQNLLVEALKPIKVQLNHKVQSLRKESDKYILEFRNRKQIGPSIIVAADGLNSIVRQHIFSDNALRNAKQICWRGYTQFKLPVKYDSELNEAWGCGSRFGFVRINKNLVYWYALKSYSHAEIKYTIDNLENFFIEYSPLVNEIIKSTPQSHIHTSQILDLMPMYNWFKYNVCLIGDAAHATTPNLGQGACQAIEDAYVLSECLAKYDYPKAFSEYQKLRMPKAHQVVNKSWVLGKIAHLSNPLLVGLRNMLLRLIPNSINTKLNDDLFKVSEV